MQTREIMASKVYVCDPWVGFKNGTEPNTACFHRFQVSGSMTSICSGDFGNLEVKGSIQFAVEYVDSMKELHVFVAQCENLAAADVRKQRSDP